MLGSLLMNWASMKWYKKLKTQTNSFEVRGKFFDVKDVLPYLFSRRKSRIFFVSSF